MNPDKSRGNPYYSASEEMRRSYTEKTCDHILCPRNTGEFRDADGFAAGIGRCGDTIQIYLRIKDGRIKDAAFLTDSCGATVACGSMATEIVKGRTVAGALELTAGEISRSLGGLPESNFHCAVLAENTLKEAVIDYLSLQREPWKKAYRRIEAFQGKRQ